MKNEKIKSDTLGSPLHPSQSIHGAKPSIGKKKRSWPLAGPPLLFMTQLRAAAPVSCVIFVIIFSFFFRCQNASVVPQCLKVTEKVSFNIVRIHFEWTKVDWKWSILASFWKTWCICSNSVTRQVNFKRTKIVEKSQSFSDFKPNNTVCKWKSSYLQLPYK